MTKKFEIEPSRKYRVEILNRDGEVIKSEWTGQCVINTRSAAVGAFSQDVIPFRVLGEVGCADWPNDSIPF